MATFRLYKDQYKKFLSHLDEYKADYERIYCGTSEKFIFRGNTYLLFDKDNTGKGFHLSPMINKDIDDWLSNNKDNLIKREHDYKEQYFNLDAIEKNIGQPVLAYDIKDCYWSILYKLGYITQKTYVMGKKKDREWKIGRVASIGSLAKIKTIVPHIKGVPQYKLREVVKTPIEYQYIRNNVIGYVYDMFKRLREEIGDKQFFMFLTDCVYFDSSQVNYVKKFINAKGLYFTAKSIEFYAVDREKKAVGWFDFSEEEETKRKKYYQYNNLQLNF